MPAIQNSPGIRTENGRCIRCRCRYIILLLECGDSAPLSYSVSLVGALLVGARLRQKAELRHDMPVHGEPQASMNDAPTQKSRLRHRTPKQISPTRNSCQIFNDHPNASSNTRSDFLKSRALTNLQASAAPCSRSIIASSHSTESGPA
jgi:hypothetical protein